MDIQLTKKILEIMEEKTGMKELSENINFELELKDAGINSISFINIVVSIEIEFGFEFGDSDLDYKKYSTLKSLVTYVESKLNTLE